MVMLQFTKKEQDKLGDKIKSLKEDIDKVLIKYNFEYDGNGLDITNGFYDIFWYEKTFK